MKLMKNAKGFTLVEIMIVVAIIGLLAAIAVPNFVQARQNAQRGACINNLRLIAAAEEQIALDQGLANGAPAPANAVIATFMRQNTFPVCPGGGVYVVNAVGVNPVCGLAAAPNLHVMP